jgi:hypothetical protein
MVILFNETCSAHAVSIWTWGVRASTMPFERRTDAHTFGPGVCERIRCRLRGVRTHTLSRPRSSLPQRTRMERPLEIYRRWKQVLGSVSGGSLVALSRREVPTVALWAYHILAKSGGKWTVRTDRRFVAEELRTTNKIILEFGRAVWGNRSLISNFFHDLV